MRVLVCQHLKLMSKILPADRVALRARLRTMSDNDLKAYARSVSGNCRPGAQRSHPLSSSELFMAEIQTEWRERHPANADGKQRSLSRYLDPYS
jgi:hypothetical protein